MIIPNKYKINILVLLLIFLPLIHAEEEFVVDVGKGNCVDVDLNYDEIPDVIICYNEDESVTINDIVSVDEDLESVIDEEDTIIIPSSTTTIKRYVFGIIIPKRRVKYLSNLHILMSMI